MCTCADPVDDSAGGQQVTCGDGETLMNVGEDCWSECDERDGPCSWCGTSGLCCREGWTGNGCHGQIGGESMHMCTCEEPVDDSAGGQQVTCGDGETLMNVGEDCWSECDERDGPCSWCG